MALKLVKARGTGHGDIPMRFDCVGEFRHDKR